MRRACGLSCATCKTDECVALLGPPLSEKSHLLRDVAEALEQGGRFRPLYVDLWRTRSNDEVAFFTSLAWLLGQRAEGLRAARSRRPGRHACDSRTILPLRAGASGHSLALLIDHLQALPHDLVHSLLRGPALGLHGAGGGRAAQFVAVVTGGMNLVGLSTGPTSPFNIAKPVVVPPLTPEQSRALAEATLTRCGARHPPPALDASSSGRRRPLPDPPALRVERRTGRACTAAPRDARRGRIGPRGRCVARRQDLPPIRAAIRMIEEDPDTMLDVLHLLDHGALPRVALPPDAHPHRHRPAAALGRSRAGGWALQPS